MQKLNTLCNLWGKQHKLLMRKIKFSNKNCIGFCYNIGQHFTLRPKSHLLNYMECQKQKKKEKIYPYLLFIWLFIFLCCISINIFKFLVDYLHAIHIFILHYMVIHFLHCISINIFKSPADYLHVIHIFILRILYIFIAYNAICITSAFLYYMQVLLHMLLAYF